MTDMPSHTLPSNRLSQLQRFVEEHGLPIFRGIEKEGLRSKQDFDIAQSNHPKALGHPLTHPLITTDYSEALLELITPVEASREALANRLEAIHRYTLNHIDDELLWVGSMPCRLNGNASIRIAEYGDSNIGKLKHVYRQGLGARYGRIMQSIAGLHFNFSLSDDYWQDQRTNSASSLSLMDYKSEQYFAMTRNFRRYSWLLMYLFGASPTLDKSFLNGETHHLKAFDNKGSYYQPYATSLRMSDLGYHNNAQSSLAICFNTLDNFTNTLKRAIQTPYAEYEKIGIKQNNKFIQLNTSILQIENEYYSSIRPKRSTKPNEKPNQALTERGVEYLEVRCLDLNPFLATGISPQQIDFMDLFLLYCLLKDSPWINDAECDALDLNFDLTVNEGRNPNLSLKCGEALTQIPEWGKQLLDGMRPIANILDASTKDGRYKLALDEQTNKVLDPELTPSAQVLAIMKQESLSWLEFAGELSRKHKSTLTDPKNPKALPDQSELSLAAHKSFEDAEQILAQDKLPFEEFMHAYQQQ